MPEARGLSLQAFLVTPVQRIPRYKMLLEDMLKHTPEDHPDHENLRNALKLVSEIAKSVNETIRNHELMLKMLDIQKSIIGFPQNILVPGRRFLKSGKVLKMSRRAVQLRHIFLFSDMILFSSPGILEETFLYHRHISLHNFELVDIPDSDGIQFIKI